MNNKINSEILNGFVNMIISDVAQKYFLKLKEERKKPPKLIEEYLDDSVYLLQKYKKIEISKMKNIINDLNQREQNEFKKIFETDKEYEFLCKELNFAYLLMVDEQLQEKTLELLYNNVYEIKILIDQEIVTKRQININSVMEQSDKRKINKIRYKNNLSNYMRA